MAVYLEQVVALGHLNAGRAQWRAEIGIPILSRVDALDAIAAVLNGVIGAEQPHGHRRVRRKIAAAGEERVADDELAAGLRDEVSQVGSMADVGDERAVLLVHGLPVGAVHLGVVKEIALRTPRFLENLRPLHARIY